MLRALLFTHRWLGVALCALFIVWFPSGIGMMYWGYPEITDRDRLARGVDLDPATIRILPTDIFATMGRPGPPLDIRLASYDGRPVYRYTDAEGESVWFADSGDQHIDVSDALMRRVAADWAGQPEDQAEAVRLDQVDQWTLQVPFRQLQPIWKFAWPGGDHVYVSALTGEVVQHTTRASRLGAYAGPITHWLYFTPLRKNGRQWSQVVIWTSAVGTVSAVLGLVIAVWVYLPKRRVPYQGQKRWHMLLGLIFGIATVTWGFSGLLSMDPFPSFSGASARRQAAASAVPEALQSRPDMAAFFGKDPRAALNELKGQRVRELAMTVIAGEAAYLATLADGSTRVVPVTAPPRDEFDRASLTRLIATAAASAGGADISLLDTYDRYYLDRRGSLPLPVLLVQMRDEASTRYYVDPKTARVVGGYSEARWVNRWLYHALHSLDFPWLYRWRPLWDVVVIAFMLGGTALAVTSLVLAWRVLGRQLSLVMPR